MAAGERSPSEVPLPSKRWVCLDVGETMIDETRIWSTWADVIGVPRLTLMAVLGAVIARGGEHHDAFASLGVPDWRPLNAAVNTAFGGFRTEDLYPDAPRIVGALEERGYRVAIIANQPSARGPELRALGVTAEVMAMSQDLGVSKPDPAFFAQALELMGSPDPAEVAYVGDRLDNDVRPAHDAGMRTVWIRRGPWAAIHSTSTVPHPEPNLVVHTLDELGERIGEAW